MMEHDRGVNDERGRAINRRLRATSAIILHSRAAWRQILPNGIGRDPGFDTLLTLYQHDEHCLIRDDFLRGSGEFGGSTRWISALEQLGLVVCSEDYVGLSEQGTRLVEEGLGLVLDSQMTPR